MTKPPAGSRLHGCLRGFPAVALELSADGTVVDSNGRLEELLGRDVMHRPFADLLDATSGAKWQRLLAGRGASASGDRWELVLEGRSSLELRSFLAIWGEDEAGDTLWLLEYSRDLRLEPLYEELSAANSELVNYQRELAKERARLTHVVAKEAEARAAAERATARLRALHATSASASATDSLHDTARRFLAGLRDALEADTATLLLLAAEGETLEVFATVGVAKDAREASRTPVTQGFAGRIATERRSVVVPDTRQGDAPGRQGSAIRSVAGAPLLTGDQLLGVVHVGSVSLRHFTAEDVQFLELVARDLAAAIERARLLEAERAAREDAERAVRLRDEVLAIVAHDLRNPLARITTAASFLTDESLEAESRQQLLRVMQRTAGVMNRLVRDLLDVASIEAGRLAVDRRPMAVEGLVSEVCEMFRPPAEERGLHFECSMANGIPMVSADQARLVQVLSNLLDNALRLTPAGGRIRVGAEKAGEMVQLSISDTGPGMAADELPHLFDRYWQGHRSRRGSAGLGLAIAKGIVDAHNGRLWAESTVGQGSTFFILLPASYA